MVRVRRSSKVLSYVSDLTLECELGSGSYGTVYRATWCASPAAAKARGGPRARCGRGRAPQGKQVAAEAAGGAVWRKGASGAGASVGRLSPHPSTLQL